MKVNQYSGLALATSVKIDEDAKQIHEITRIFFLVLFRGSSLLVRLCYYLLNEFGSKRNDKCQTPNVQCQMKRSFIDNLKGSQECSQSSSAACASPKADQ